MEFAYREYPTATEIHTFLNHDYTPWRPTGKQAFLVHHSIFDKFQKKLEDVGKIPITSENIWEFNLRIGLRGKDAFNQDMYLVWVEYENSQQAEFLFEFFASSIYSFPWEDNPIIYLPLHQFNLVEEYIRKENLEKFIIATRYDRSRTCSLYDIKIIEFSKEAGVQVAQKFGRFVSQNHEMLNAYFIVQPFGYLKPSYLESIDKPLKKNTYRNMMVQVLLLLEYHRDMAKKDKEIFNIFDLIAMKLAIDDPRLEYGNCEFHKAIDKILKTMTKEKTYIAVKKFNLADYQSDRAICSRSIEIYQYLLYNFQKYFKTVLAFLDTNFTKIRLSKINHLNDLIANISDETILHIDGTNLNANSATVLFDLLSNPIIQRISIDMHFETGSDSDTDLDWDPNKNVWIYDSDGKYAPPVLGQLPTQLILNIVFTGSNRNNFIENFLNWLKLYWHRDFNYLRLTFAGFKRLSPYIFNRLNIKTLNFESITISSRLVNALKLCNYEQIYFSECQLQENDYQLLESLAGLDRVECIYIKNEMNTCGSLMDLIRNELEKCLVYQFKAPIHITPYINVDFKALRFFINEEKTKLEVYDTISKQTINLYDYLYDEDDEAYNNRENFEFYT